MTVLKAPILKLLHKTYAPGSMLEMKFKRYDLAIKTDEMGRPILLFLGEKRPDYRQDQRRTFRQENCRRC